MYTYVIWKPDTGRGIMKAVVFVDGPDYRSLSRKICIRNQKYSSRGKSKLRPLTDYVKDRLKDMKIDSDAWKKTR